MSKIAQVRGTDALADGMSLVLFVLGAAGVPPEPPLPGPALVRLLDALGLSEAAARSTILRMRKAGWLTSTRTGPTVGYAPSPATLAGHRRQAESWTGTASGWNGSFHALIVSVPEHRRSYRDSLRRAAAIAGYRSLHTGLLIAPTDRRAEIEPTLARLPQDASVRSAQLHLSTGDNQAVAAELWELEGLASRYRALALAARELTVAAVDAQEGSTPGPDTVRALAAATLPIFEAIRDDPGLPPQLLPPAWPQPELRAALSEAINRLSPATLDYIEQLRAEYPARPAPTRP